jgi:hypothetical protein
MRELLVRDKNTIDPEVIDPGGRSVEDSPVKSDFTFNNNNNDVTLYLKTEADPVPVTLYYSNCITFSVLQDRKIPCS